MKKKITALALVICLLAVAVVGGTMAYFTDTDSAKNTMTIGSVEIKQIEQERDANGALVPFTQNKPIVPSVGVINWADTGVVIGGHNQKVFSNKNAIDKFVSVENTGKSAAFVRTIIALEAPEGFNDDLAHVNINEASATWSGWDYTTVDGTRYVYNVATYNEALAPGAHSPASLAQVFLDSTATNKDVKALGDTWEILAVSQAVQADGFDAPAAALNEAFGEANPTNAAEWLKYAGTTVVYDADDLKDAIENGDGNITLGGDIDLNNGLVFP